MKVVSLEDAMDPRASEQRMMRRMMDRDDDSSNDDDEDEEEDGEGRRGNVVIQCPDEEARGGTRTSTIPTRESSARARS